MIQVYYAEMHEAADAIGLGSTHTAIVTSEKTFFDTNRCLPDGPGSEPHYETIMQAFDAAGWSEDSESFYMGPKDLPKLKAAMAAQGIELIENSDLLGDHD